MKKATNINPGDHAIEPDEPHTPGLGVEDVLYTLFRHKWLIIAFVCLGVAGAVAVRFIKPPLYQSKAKINVPYVVDINVENTADPEKRVTSTTAGGLVAILQEIEILKSLDVGEMVADDIGPEKILAKKGGGNDRMAAAGVIAGGIVVDPPQTATITVTFQHPDPEIVQPVLTALLKAYALKSDQVHKGKGIWDEYFAQQRTEWSKKLAATEEQLRTLKNEAKLLDLDETKHTIQGQITKLQERLFEAEIELAERKGQLGSAGVAALSATATNGAAPREKMEDYSATVARLDYLVRHERRLLAEGLKEAHPWVQSARTELADRKEHKLELEKKYPELVGSAIAGPPGSTNTFDTDAAAIKRLTANVAVYTTQLSNAQYKASQLMELEPKVAELQRIKNLQETNYQFFLTRLDEARASNASGGNQMMNFSVIQSPSPPGLDLKKMLKLIGMALGGCIAAGLGLAFLIDLVLDRTLKRRGDVERHLHLPMFLSIPDTAWTKRRESPKPGRNQRVDIEPAAKSPANGIVPYVGNGSAPWDDRHDLKQYMDGLRERIITYFEVNELNHKPKLVAVTGCAPGAGVSTLAGGLAAALSKTGTGNVLLVDMNAGDGTAQSFHKGKPGCDLAQPLESDAEAEALYLDARRANDAAKADLNGADSMLAQVLPSSFNDLVPKLRAADYDYIVFDMPPVTQTSVTPRLASHMDMVLLILESEKTSQHIARQANALLQSSRSTVATVLNKCRPYVPARFSHES